VTAKQVVARTVAVALAVIFIAFITAGAYYDAGGWPGVAVVWGAVVVLLGMVHAFLWALDNWNAQ
jgi:hypothetical protein